MIQIFNQTNHKFNASILQLLQDFSTDDYCGVLGESTADTFSIADNKISVNSELVSNNALIIISGGNMLTIDVDDLSALEIKSNYYYYIDVDLTKLTNDNIITDESESLNLISKKITTSINNEITTYQEMNQTVWITKHTGFHIPLFYIDKDGNLQSLIVSKDKTTLEQWLSIKALADLWAQLHNTFVHQSGSTEENDTYGKLGNYNFNGDNIQHNDSAFISSDSSNRLHLDTYSNGGLYIEDKTVVSGTIPVTAGGTGATTTLQAKKNLGIYYGTANPNEIAPVESPNEGDLYFQILE